MTNTAGSVSLIGWAGNLSDIAASPYTYVVMGSIFFIILLIFLWLFIFKSGKNKNTDTACTSIDISVEKLQGDPVISVYKKITTLKNGTKSILLAGAGLECLPITIPIKTAVQLAQSGKKILLMDLDTRRNAVAKVFDLKDNVFLCASPKPLPSPVENLFLWPAEFFTRFVQMNLPGAIQAAENRFDVILINAPYLDGHPDRNIIAASAKRGLIFCKTTQQFDRLKKLLAESRCLLLEEKPL